MEEGKYRVNGDAPHIVSIQRSGSPPLLRSGARRDERRGEPTPGQPSCLQRCEPLDIGYGIGSD